VRFKQGEQQRKALFGIIGSDIGKRGGGKRGGKGKKKEQKVKILPTNPWETKSGEGHRGGKGKRERPRLSDYSF